MAGTVVSVLVPSFNAARYLGTLARSVLEQSFPDFELLILDDGSTDNTREVVAPFLQDARTRYVVAPANQGLGKSLRWLITQAKGEFWCSPGADDVLFPNFLKQRVALLRQHPDAVLAHGLAEHIDENGRALNNVSGQVHPPPRQPGADALLALLEHNYINQPSALVRASATRAIMPYWQEEWTYAPDWYLWLLHAGTMGSFLYDSLPAHYYRMHQHSLTGASRYEAVRRAETRLVPLVGCGAAAKLSAEGNQIWKKWRHALYALWLRRAWVLKGRLDLKEMLRSGAAAFHEREIAPTPGLLTEMIRHWPQIAWFSFRESLARSGISFQPSGLAQIRHELFRNPAGITA